MKELDELVFDGNLIENDSDFDFAITLDRYMENEANGENGVEQLSMIQMDLDSDVSTKNVEAIKEAIALLMMSHPAEFEEYLKVERRARGIDGIVTTGWKQYLDSIRERDTKL